MRESRPLRSPTPQLTPHPPAPPKPHPGGGDVGSIFGTDRFFALPPMARPAPGGSRSSSRRDASARPSAARPEAPRTAARAARASGPRLDAGPPSWWTHLSPLARHGLCLAALLVVAIAVTAPVVFGAGSIVGGDAVQWRSMAASMLDYAKASGEEPLWATNPFGGMPGVMVTRVASIPGLDTFFDALRSVMWPLSHLVALLGGLYGLVYALTRRHGPAVVAALVFGLTTYLAILLPAGHNSKYIALCYTPALFWAFFEAVRRPRLLSALLFAVALGLNIRAGHPQITYYAAWALGLWWIAEGVGAGRSGQVARFGRATAFLALGSVLAIGMSAHPLVQQIEYKTYTIRGAESASASGADDAFRYAMAWSQGWAEMLTLLVADAFGGGGQTYFGPKAFTAGPHYVGGVAVLFAIVGLVYGRRRVAWSLGAALALMLVFALGENAAALNRLAYDLVPLFKSFRVPETWLSVAACLIAILAGLGVAAVVRRGADDVEASGATKASRGALIAGVALVALVALLFVMKGSRSYERPGEQAQIAGQIAQQNGVDPADPRVAQAATEYAAASVAERADLYGADLLRTLLVLAVATGLVFLVRRGTVPAWALAPALALVVAVDLGGVAQRYLNKDALTPASAPEDLIQRFAYDDFVVGRVADAGGMGHFRTLVLDGGDLASSARPAAFYETLSGYHGAKLRLYQDYLDHILVGPQGGLNPNALPLMGVRYVVAGGQVAPGMAPVFVDSTARMAVFETPAQGAPAPATAADSARAATADSLGALGLRSTSSVRTDRAWFASTVEALADDPAVWARLQDPALDVHRTALVAAPTTATTTPIGPASTATARLVRYTPREIAYNVETDAPRLFVFSEVYYPAGWTATVARRLHLRGRRRRDPARRPPAARRAGARRAPPRDAPLRPGLVPHRPDRRGRVERRRLRRAPPAPRPRLRQAPQGRDGGGGWGRTGARRRAGVMRR